MERICPHCGTPLPDESAFCPHCARNVRERKTPKIPIPLRRKVLLGLLALAVLAALGGGMYWAARPYVPQEYDGAGEVYYTLDDTAYQILVAWPNDRCAPAPDIYQNGRAEETTRWPSRLYVNYKDTGADGWDAFSQQVDAVRVEVEQDENGASDLVAEEPTVRDDYSPDAAMVSTLDFAGDCGEPQVVWILEMKNGDVIRVRQTMHVTLINSYVYDYHDYPMETMEELQALVEQIGEETDRLDEVLIYLPPVTYEGKLELTGRSFEFHGCTDGTGRTVFTDTVQVATKDSYWLNFFYDIDFVGSGTGVGLSFAESGRATRCTFTGWKTAVLGYGYAWVNVIECQVTDNQTGFHFNSIGQSANHTLYTDNVFARNGTAVLLENVPTDLMMDFSGSVFTDNGTDIDNRCAQPVDLSQATFDGAGPA